MPPPRKGKAPLVVGLVLGLVVLPLLLCVGGGYYFAEWVPKQEFKARQALYEKLGVPEAFTRDLVDDDEDFGNTLDTFFYLDCPKGVCPANPTTSIHEWMTDNGAVNLTASDVAECIKTVQEARAVNCDPPLRWERDGQVINLFPMGLTMGKTVKDTRFKLSVSISTPD
ncbi:hypothetical protein GCM10025331_76160 [Actinoplanes utahensis]|nr:hypothetical protein Aut01nite_66670 [Actinoplanes utahensis]